MTIGTWTASEAVRFSAVDAVHRSRSSLVLLLALVAPSLLACLTLGACGSFGAGEPPGGADAGPTADAASSDGNTPGDAASSTDAGTDAAADATDRDAACNGEADCPRWVFVSSETFSGEDIGGAISADGRCTNRAALPATAPALRGRKYKAWLSDEGTNTSVDARLTHGTAPYRLADGTLIANTWAQLTSGVLLHAIDRDETNAPVTTPLYVWTGTTPFGTKAPTTCTGWTLSGIVGDKGTVGYSAAADSSWTNSGSMPCGTGLRLYCVEQ